MHCLNCSIFYPAIMKQSWLSTENKIRLLEWKGRNDLTMYVSRRSPKLLRDEIIDYMPKQPSSGSDPWSGIFERVKHYEDDGHAPKLVRAIAHGEQVCRPYEKSDPFGIKGDMWLKLGNMGESLHERSMLMQKLIWSKQSIRWRVLEHVGFDRLDSTKLGLILKIVQEHSFRLKFNIMVQC